MPSVGTLGGMAVSISRVSFCCSVLQRWLGMARSLFCLWLWWPLRSRLRKPTHLDDGSSGLCDAHEFDCRFSQHQHQHLYLAGTMSGAARASGTTKKGAAFTTAPFRISVRRLGSARLLLRVD